MAGIYIGKKRPYSASPRITSRDRCRATLPRLDLLLGMGATSHRAKSRANISSFSDSVSESKSKVTQILPVILLESCLVILKINDSESVAKVNGAETKLASL